jgi:hypothetical protein
MLMFTQNTRHQTFSMFKIDSEVKLHWLRGPPSSYVSEISWSLYKGNLY